MIRFILILASIYLPFAAAAQKEVFDIYAVDSIREIRITFQENDWDQILDSLKQRGYDQRLIGDVTYGGKTYTGAGIRYKGNSSYFSVRKSGYSKLPFNIDVNVTNKEEKLPGGYDKLKLSNVFRDPSFLREVLSYEIAGNYMPAPRANYVKLYINKKYMGLYNNTESIDDEFLNRYYNEKKGPLFKCDPIWGYEQPSSCKDGEKASLEYLGADSICYKGKYELKSKYGWAELINLTEVLNKDINKLGEIFNIDQALWMLAFNNVLVNLDSYTGRFCHNYYLYEDKEGVFHPIIWDMNLSFGGFRYLGVEKNLKPLNNEAMQTLSPLVHYKQQNERRPLITNLLSEPLYRKIYLAHIRTILEEQFTNGNYMKRAKELQSLIGPYVMEDDNKLYEAETFLANIDTTAKADKVSIIGIGELMNKRIEYLQKHPLIKKPPPEITKVEHIDFGDMFVFNAYLEGATKAWMFYRYGDKGAFKKLELFDDSGHADVLAEDGNWGNTLDKKKKDIQYYIVAENDNAAALMPARAAFEYLTTAEGSSSVK